MSFASLGTNTVADGRESAAAVRILPARKSLPGSRAIVGGVLVALAALGTYALATGATTAPTTSVVVAAHPISAGTRLGPEDVKTVATDLDPALAAKTVGNPAVVIGTTTLGPIGEGELVQPGNLVAKTANASSPEVSFALPSARALGGSLVSGETVDILVTTKDQPSASARTAVTNARVVKISSGSSAIGATGDTTVTVSVASRAEAAAVAAAVDGGEVTLVRTTGLHDSASPTSVSP